LAWKILSGLTIEVGSLLIGTSQKAVTATHALVVVNRDNAVFPLACSTGGTNIHAGRIFTMITKNRVHLLSHRGVFTRFPNDDAIPIDSPGQEVLGSAGHEAGPATNASFQINNHAPSFHLFTPGSYRL
jgi:hypothetical protein